MRKGYGKVNSVICEVEADSTDLLEALTMTGIGNVKVCKDITSLANMLEEGLVDLVFCNFDTAGQEFLDFIKKVRRRKARGRNPFVIVIATVSNANVATVKTMIDAGVDDLIRKPFTIDRVVDGVTKLARSRKPFVACFDYVGPTRRAPQRDSLDSASLIQVPNTLHGKVMRNESDAQLQRALDLALIDIEDKQLEAVSREIVHMVERIGEASENPERHGELGGLRDRLHLLSEDFCQRSEKSASPQLTNLTKLFSSILSRTREKSADEVNNLRLLSKLAAAIYRAVTVERDALDLMREMVEAVAFSASPP